MINSQIYCLDKLNSVIVNFLLVAIFFLPLSQDLTTLCLAISALGWFAKLALTRGSCFQRFEFDSWILFFGVVSFASVFVSPDIGFSFYNYYHLMGKYILIYYLTIQNITTFKQLKNMVTIMAISAIIVVLYGYYQYIFGIDVSNMLWVDGEKFPELKTRVFSTLQNPNILAGYLLVIMMLVFGLICKTKSRLNLYVLILFFIVLGTCLAMTYCRGAWISLLVVLGAYGTFKNWRVLIVLMFLAIGAGLLDDSLAERFLSVFHSSDSSSAMRVGIWESTVAMIIDHPLLGIGWGAYWICYPLYDFFIQNDKVLIVHAHNMYLNIAAETGVFSLVAFIVIFFKHMGLALSSTHLRESAFLNGLTLGCGLSMIVVALNGFTDYVLFNIELSMMFWLVYAVVILICRKSLD